MAFIGRHDEREQIKELLISTDFQVLQIYGLPSTGKTDLIRQVSRILLDNLIKECYCSEELSRRLKSQCDIYFFAMKGKLNRICSVLYGKEKNDHSECSFSPNRPLLIGQRTSSEWDCW